DVGARTRLGGRGGRVGTCVLGELAACGGDVEATHLEGPREVRGHRQTHRAEPEDRDRGPVARGARGPRHVVRGCAGDLAGRRRHRVVPSVRARTAARASPVATASRRLRYLAFAALTLSPSPP